MSYDWFFFFLAFVWCGILTMVIVLLPLWRRSMDMTARRSLSRTLRRNSRLSRLVFSTRITVDCLCSTYVFPSRSCRGKKTKLIVSRVLMTVLSRLKTALSLSSMAVLRKIGSSRTGCTWDTLTACLWLTSGWRVCYLLTRRR